MDHPILVGFLLLAIIAFMYFAAEVIKPLALAILLSLALAPFVKRLERVGVPRGGAVVFSVLTTLLLLGVIGMIVTQQLNSLAQELPRYESNIRTKVAIFRSSKQSTVEKLKRLGSKVSEELAEPATRADRDGVKPVAVRIEREPTALEQMASSLGPVLETLAIGFFVLILVLFILLHRDQLNDRIVRLFGDRLVTKTTRTMEEVGHRISRYLAMFATVNSTFGLIIGIGLYLMGIPYAVLWGFLAAMLRFIPYAGPASAFALPLMFSIAHFDGWTKPLEVIALFGVMEILANSFLEPVIYGKTTGVSALGLLVAAMFWTWLWGAVGLLLSTPLTVCLAVVGKYVPSLSAFGILLGDETELEPDVKLFQRLIAYDQAGARQFIDERLKKQTRFEVFETTMMPALARMERDYALGAIDEKERAFTLRIMNEVLADLKQTPEIALLNSNGPEGPAREERPTVVGISAGTEVDAVILEMVSIAFEPLGVDFSVVPGDLSPLEVCEKLRHETPDVIVVSHLSSRGTGKARYLVKRLNAAISTSSIVVGCWMPRKRSGLLIERYRDMGARSVVFSLTGLRDRILELARLKAGPQPVSSISKSSTEKQAADV
jgi:predicted PurR-regulated permease PerM/methylmalonyl-CoA mutase cobalamin-binding subunit